MKNVERPGVMLYFDALNPALARLTDDQCGALLRGIVQYAQTGAIPELDGMPALAFDLLRPGIDRDAARYDATVEQRRYAVYCREARKRGESPCSLEEWQHEASTDNDRYQPLSVDNERYPTTTPTPATIPTPTTTPTPATIPTPTTTPTPATIPTPASTSTTTGDTTSTTTGDTRGVRGDDPTALYTAFVEALDEGDMKTASHLSNALYACGFDVDKETREMTRRC